MTASHQNLPADNKREPLASPRVEKIARLLDPSAWREIDRLSRKGAELPDHLIYKGVQSKSKAAHIVAADPLTPVAKLMADALENASSMLDIDPVVNHTLLIAQSGSALAAYRKLIGGGS